MKFKVGDKVKILDVSYVREPTRSEVIGCIGIITDIFEGFNFPFSVCVDETQLGTPTPALKTFRYKEDELELVETKEKWEQKAEAIVAGMHDSGKRQEFNTGIKNDKTDDKLPMELIPPETIVGYAEVMRMGAKKYAPNNWLKGIKYSRLYAAAIRHLLIWFLGEDNDSESGLSHLKHALWNIGALITFTERNRKELDDRNETK